MDNQDADILVLPNKDIQQIINANNKKNLIVNVKSTIIPSLKEIDKFLRKIKVNNCTKRIITNMSDSLIVSNTFVPNFISLFPSFTEGDFVIYYKERNTFISYKGLPNIGKLPQDLYVFPNNITVNLKAFKDNYMAQVNGIMSTEELKNMKVENVMPKYYKLINLNTKLIDANQLFKTIFGIDITQAKAKFYSIYYMNRAKNGQSKAIKTHSNLFNICAEGNNINIDVNKTSYMNNNITIGVNNIPFVNYNLLNFNKLVDCEPVLN